MILPEIIGKLCEIQMKLKDNGGAKIEDICTVQEGEYGYVVVLTSFKGNIHDDVLAAKLNELHGKRIMPDLWVFGPCIRSSEKQLNAEIKQEQK